jgi:hypothetical protein
MTIANPPPDFVIRLGDVKVDRQTLIASVGQEVDRYERSQPDPSQYAQISMQRVAEDWEAVAAFVAGVGPRIKALIDRKLVGSACIDFAVLVKPGTYANFFTVPAAVAEKAGMHLIDIEASIYMAEPESRK